MAKGMPLRDRPRTDTSGPKPNYRKIPYVPPEDLMYDSIGIMGDCPNCGSSTVKRFIFFGRKIGCIQPECPNYYKKELVQKKKYENVSLPLQEGKIKTNVKDSYTTDIKSTVAPSPPCKQKHEEIPIKIEVTVKYDT